MGRKNGISQRISIAVHPDDYQTLHKYARSCNGSVTNLIKSLNSVAADTLCDKRSTPFIIQVPDNVTKCPEILREHLEKISDDIFEYYYESLEDVLKREKEILQKPPPENDGFVIFE